MTVTTVTVNNNEQITQIRMSILMIIIIIIIIRRRRRITINIIEISESKEHQNMLTVIEEDCQWTAYNTVDMHSNKKNNAFSKILQKIGPPFDKVAFLPKWPF